MANTMALLKTMVKKAGLGDLTIKNCRRNGNGFTGQAIFGNGHVGTYSSIKTSKGLEQIVRDDASATNIVNNTVLRRQCADASTRYNAGVVNQKGRDTFAYTMVERPTAEIPSWRNGYRQQYHTEYHSSEAFMNGKMLNPTDLSISPKGEHFPIYEREISRYNGNSIDFGPLAFMENIKNFLVR